jgi:hypothetical protein
VRRFIIVTDRTTPEARNKLSTWLKEDELVAWWHWFQNAWLVVDPSDREPAWWRDQVQAKITPGHVMVIEADGGSWAAYGRRKAFNWLKEQWSKQGPGPKQGPGT